MTFVLKTGDLILRSSDINFAKGLLDYYQRNQSFLERFEPKRDDSFYTFESQYIQLKKEIEDADKRTTFRFYAFHKNDDKKIIACIGLSNIVWGNFMSCFLGYKMDKQYVNNGYMTQLVYVIVNFAFAELHLHRIEANVMPRNKASLRVLEKCGFVNEGRSRKYLQINGIWEDHVHMVRINEHQ